METKVYEQMATRIFFLIFARFNCHKCRNWSDSNPKIFREIHAGNLVWTGIFAGRIIGPFVLARDLTREMFLHMYLTF